MNKNISAAIALASLAVTGVAFAQKVSDAQIAQIVVTANSIDIDNGKIALKNSKTASVDEFANLMIKDHTAVNNNAVALVTKLGVKPEDSDVNKSLKSAADTEQAKLKGLSGAAFDKEYLTNEVAYHKQVIGRMEPIARADCRAMMADRKR